MPEARRFGIDVVTWDEPSEQRPDGPPFRKVDAFDHWLDTAEAFLLSHADAPVTLIGHSYGSHAVNHLCACHPDRIAAAVFAAPALVQTAVERNMLTIARDDFREHGGPLSEELDGVLRDLSGAYDENLVRGIELLLQNPRFFAYYWRDGARMGDYMPLFEGPRYSLDLDSYFAVRSSHHEVEHEGCAVPVVAVLGEHDPVVDARRELELLGHRFRDVSNVTFCHAGHYPHIEETAHFLEVVAEAASG